MNTCLVFDLGLTDYSDTMLLQKKLTESRMSGACPDVILFTEHRPVVTIGRFVKPGDERCEITIGREELGEMGISVLESDRGGRVTYHGPGQLVVYPIIHLKENKLTVKRYVWILEESIIQVLNNLDINSQRRSGLNGVWIAKNKIAAVGLRVDNWVTRHGIALNVDIDLLPFRYIIPCGISDAGVTSITKETGGRKASITAIKESLMNVSSSLLDTKIVISGGIKECTRMLEYSLNGSGKVLSTSMP